MSFQHSGGGQKGFEREEHNHQGGDGTKRGAKNIMEIAHGLQVDEASATVTYIGRCAPGTATSENKWQIQKIDTTSGTSITFADGNDEFDNVWDDRASLSYS